MKRKIKVLIIDQNVEERRYLEKIIKNDTEASVLGSLADITKVFSLSFRKKADLIFIGTELLVKSPIRVLGEVKEINDHLEIALIGQIDDFQDVDENIGILGSLQKPYSESDIRMLFDKLKLQNATRNVKSNRSKANHFCLSHKKIRFDNRSNIMMIDPQHIIFIEADNCYSDIVLMNDKRETLSLTLAEVERIVPSEIFFRISRTHIINLRYLNLVKRREKQCELIVNDQSLWFKISRNRIRSLENAL